MSNKTRPPVRPTELHGWPNTEKVIAHVTHIEIKVLLVWDHFSKQVARNLQPFKCEVAKNAAWISSWMELRPQGSELGIRPNWKRLSTVKHRSSAVQQDHNWHQPYQNQHQFCVLPRIVFLAHNVISGEKSSQSPLRHCSNWPPKRAKQKCF